MSEADEKVIAALDAWENAPPYQTGEMGRALIEAIGRRGIKPSDWRFLEVVGSARATKIRHLEGQLAEALAQRDTFEAAAMMAEDALLTARLELDEALRANTALAREAGEVVGRADGLGVKPEERGHYHWENGAKVYHSYEDYVDD